MTSPALPTITLTSPDEVVTALPHVLGFIPAESVVILCLGAPEGAPTMRVDLPSRRHTGAAARDRSGQVAATGATRAVLVVWTEQPDEDVVSAGRGHMVLARSSLVTALGRELADHGVEVTLALLVRAGRWWSFSCLESCCDGNASEPCARECCPPQGHPLPEQPGPGAVRLAAEAVGAGRGVLPDRKSLVGAVAATGTPEQWRARTAAARRARRCEVVLGGREGLDAVRVGTYRTARTTLRALTAGELRVEDLDEELTAALRVGLEDRTARDLVITLALEHDLGHLLALLGEVARRTPDAGAAPVCTVLAWVAFQRGDGALARVAVDRALRRRPDYAMAQLLERGLRQLVPPRHVELVTRAVRDDLASLIDAAG